MKTKNIKLQSWFKNNEEWYVPSNSNFLDIEQFENYEIISFFN